MKLITVENNVVFVRDTITGEEIVQDYPGLGVDFSYVIDKYTDINHYEEMPHHIHNYKERIKEFYKKVGDALGCSVRKFSSMLNGAIYRAYIQPNLEYHNRFSSVHYFGGVCRDHSIVLKVNEKSDVIKQYIMDGQEHMAGFALITGDAQTSKRILGKGLWKRLCKNSKTRNDKICVTVFKQFPFNRPKISVDEEGNLLHCAERVNIVNMFPSTLLYKIKSEVFTHICDTIATTGYKSFSDECIKHIGPVLKRIDAVDIAIAADIVRDTDRMLNTLNRKLNTKWSFIRIKKEHALAIKEIEEIKYSPKEFVSLSKLPKTIKGGKFAATLMKSAKDMYYLGKSEHHCIGSYHDMAALGEYAAYKIEDSDGAVSSLGIKHPNTKRFLNDQHYHACNASVTDHARIAFAKDVTRKVSTIMRESIRITDPKEQIKEGIFNVLDNEIPF